MNRMVLLGMLIILGSCGGNNEAESLDKDEIEFDNLFQSNTIPYRLTDTTLLENKDTTLIRNENFKYYIPDSLKQKAFGRTNGVKYSPMAKIKEPKGETYYVVKAAAGSKKAAFLIVFDKENKFGASFPFLIPDNSSATSQVSTIDKSFSISRSTLQKKPDDVLYEGKDVYVYNNDVKEFTLIMTDVLDESKTELINPIDTFARSHKWTGDYGNAKRNIVSVRDGRKDNTLSFFIHVEKDNGKCVGELRGEAQIEDEKTAVYRQPGDPCVLKLIFTANSVQLSEVEGCGLHRNLECAIEGTFKRIKEKKKNSTEK